MAPKHPQTGKAKSGASARERRLKAALKANLARRKAQARARADDRADDDADHRADDTDPHAPDETGGTQD